MRAAGRARVVLVRAEAAAAPTATPATAAKNNEHEELKRYGVFKLAYDTTNVSGVPGALWLFARSY